MDEEGGKNGSPGTASSGAAGETVDWIPIPYQSLDTSGTILRVNQAWLDALGYERSTVEGAGFETFLSPQSEESFQARFQTLLSRGRISDAKFQLIHAAGHEVPVDFEATVEYGNRGEIQQAHCQFFPVQEDHDRDDQLLAQTAKIEALLDVAMEIQQAENEEAVYEQLVAAAADILEFDTAIADAAEDGYLVPKAVSEGAKVEEYFDRVPIEGDMIGTRTYREGKPSLIRDLEDDDSGQVGHEFRSVLSVPIGEYGVFQAVDREPGAFSETDRDLVELLVSHGRNALDRLEHVEALERRTGSLSRERNRLEAIFEAVPEPVVHIRYEEGEPIVVDVNSAFEDTFGYESTEIEGRSVNELLVPEDRLERARDLDRAAETTDMVEREVTRLAADGERTFRLRSAVLETDGEPEMLVVYVDLSEQKARERELERENERLERFASIVSHDLRSPLTVASGRLDLLKAESPSPHVEEIERAIGRMDAIIDDVLTLTRGGKTVAQTEKETVDLADLAGTAWHAVDSGDAGLEIETNRTVLADRSRLRRVFENLFWNAVEHAGPSVTVTVGDTDGGFFVADDGPGIPEDQRERVFESGYSTTREGTGLGLEIVAEILEAHGWSITLTESKSGGARFEIRTE
ncbi:MAG: PAS domain S-box protein [Halodesulfurarchaeum sp.]|nr:PAS domain S-box protein [Halodesulfurarchaeum sp.]